MHRTRRVNRTTLRWWTVVACCLVCSNALAEEPRSIYVAPGVSFGIELTGKAAGRVSLGPTVSVNFWPTRESRKEYPLLLWGFSGTVDFEIGGDRTRIFGSAHAAFASILYGEFGGGVALSPKAPEPTLLLGSGLSAGFFWAGLRGFIGPGGALELAAGLAAPICVSGRYAEWSPAF